MIVSCQFFGKREMAGIELIGLHRTGGAVFEDFLVE